MEIVVLIIFLAGICNLFLSIFVFLKEPSRRLNQLFGIFGFVTIIWIFSNFVFYYKGIPDLLLLRTGYAFGALVPVSALLWVLELCNKKLSKSRIIQIIGVGFLYFLLSFTNLVVVNVKKVYLGGFEGETGPLFPLYFIYIGGLLAFIIYTLISSYLKTTGIRKLQISYVLIGAILYICVVIVVSFILPFFGILKFTALDSPSSLFLLFFTALAITRYHLFGIEVILTEILVGVIGILLVVQIFTAPSTLWRIVNGGIFVLFCVFGYLLIRGVFREIKRKEEAERIALQERELRIRSERLKDEAERLAKAKDQFILSIQHHLRTPLTPVMGYLDMILEGSFGEEKNPLIKEKLIKTRKAVEVLHKLMEDLLEVSSMRIGKKVLDLKETQIENLIEEVKLELENQAKEKGLYLKFEKPKVPLPKMKLDEKRIREVIWNLIDNAIKYTERGGVVIDCKIQDSKCLIKIKDTGIGMTKEEIDYFSEGKLFERGEKAKKLWGPGRGIGLAISFEFVKAHGGKIWIESEGREKGTIFYVELPIK